MKKIGVILIMSTLLSCEKVSLTTQPTSIKDSKVEEINKENKDIKTKNSGTGSNLVLPSSTPKPVITPVAVVVIPTALPSTSTSSSSSSQPTFINPVSSPKASNTPILPIDPDGLPPRPPQANLSNGSAGPSVSFADQPPPKPPAYSVEWPVPENLTEGEINLIFKDEYKIRRETSNIILINATFKFTSLLSNIDVNIKSQIDSVNQIMEDFNIKVSEVSTTSMTEEQAYERKKLIYDKTNYDAPNELSVYFFKLTNKPISVLINKLRKISITRECNVALGVK